MHSTGTSRCYLICAQAHYFMLPEQNWYIDGDGERVSIGLIGVYWSVEKHHVCTVQRNDMSMCNNIQNKRC